MGKLYLLHFFVTLKNKVFKKTRSDGIQSPGLANKIYDSLIYDPENEKIV